MAARGEQVEGNNFFVTLYGDIRQAVATAITTPRVCTPRWATFLRTSLKGAGQSATTEIPPAPRMRFSRHEEIYLSDVRP
jgi:hypothetical protein